MAAILVYAGVKGYQKCQDKLLKSSAGNEKKLRKNRRSISSLVIPSITSTHIFLARDEITESVEPPQFEFYEGKDSLEPPDSTVTYSPHNMDAPTRAAPPPPVMLGLPFCESPITPTSELDGNFPIGFRSTSQLQLNEDSPVYRLSHAFGSEVDEGFAEPMSPAPLHVVKRSSSPSPPLDEHPDMTYSSDESGDDAKRPRTVRRSTYLEVPELADEVLTQEPPPIPPKSPARRLRAVPS